MELSKKQVVSSISNQATDRGVGMTPETVEKVFSQYGKSKKTTNNNFVGAFGFGDNK